MDDPCREILAFDSKPAKKAGKLQKATKLILK